MEDGKGQSIFLSIIGIATLLVAVVGATFAWFSINVSGNEDSSGMVFYTNNLGQVSFTDGKEINLELAPGVFTTKEFTVEETDPSAVGQIKYNIVLNVVSNTLTPNADGQFVHSLTSTGNTNEGTTVINNYISSGSFILGIKNVTEHSGATMLTYMLKNEIKNMGKSVLAIEVEKKDFLYFNDKEMVVLF